MWSHPPKYRNAALTVQKFIAPHSNGLDSHWSIIFKWNIRLARRVWERQKQEKALTTWRINQLVTAFFSTWRIYSVSMPFRLRNQSFRRVVFHDPTVWTVWMYFTSQTKFTRTAYTYTPFQFGASILIRISIHGRNMQNRMENERQHQKDLSKRNWNANEQKKNIQFIRCVRRVVRRLSRRFHLTCFQSDRYIYLHTFMP